MSQSLNIISRLKSVLKTTLFIVTLPCVSFSLAAAVSLEKPAEAIQPTLLEQIAPELVTIGDAGNRADRTGYGAVSKSYQIGKNSVTVHEYVTFLNAVATNDIHHLWNEGMSYLITRQGDIPPFIYSIVEGKETHPIVSISFLAAARYCNWLENGQPSGEEDLATTELGSYTLSILSQGTIALNEGAHYFLPNENQWYKAAYYEGNGKEGRYLPALTPSIERMPMVGAYNVSNMVDFLFEWTSTMNSSSQGIIRGGSDFLESLQNASFTPLAHCRTVAALTTERNDLTFRIAASLPTANALTTATTERHPSDASSYDAPSIMKSSNAPCGTLFLKHYY